MLAHLVAQNAAPGDRKLGGGRDGEPVAASRQRAQADLVLGGREVVGGEVVDGAVAVEHRGQRVAGRQTTCLALHVKVDVLEGRARQAGGAQRVGRRAQWVVACVRRIAVSANRAHDLGSRHVNQPNVLFWRVGQPKA